MKLWRCVYTGEIIIGSEQGGVPLFGGIVPFLGFKKLSCNAEGHADKGMWPPKFLTTRIGMMWFGRGVFWNPPWPTEIKAVR